ncbi:hypothetical protein PInf_017346 [Phytophthora infestans]|nr:hypothetical protein PInf_017346 [Phytophthora infestans]
MDRERIERDITELSHRLDTRTGSPNAADVDKCLDLLDEVDAYLTHSVFGSDRDVDPEPNIVALGTTGAGKSTVVSFLFGERIFVRHASRYSRVLVAIPALDGVEIRSGSVSASLLPIVNHVSMQDEDVAVWDMPGYRDTRGPFVKLVCRLALEGAKEKLLELRNAVKAYRSTHEMHDSLVISAFQLRLSEELETINEFVRKHKAEYVLAKREVIPIVTLIGYASLDIDVNIQMWVEIAFISPTIVVTTSRAMDLSAKCQAKSATRINDDVGRHGAHGEPGLPGGDLTVVCKKLQDDLHVLQTQFRMANVEETRKMAVMERMEQIRHSAWQHSRK